LGVPVVSLIGKTAVGRSGLSILANLDLVELAVNTEAEYVAAAATLGGDLARLSELRNAIRSRFQRSPLRDARGAARDFANALRQAWQESPFMRYPASENWAEKNLPKS
jgi:predicted O-linked N-acetylglucosamine transferase (SPINDLY family)